MTTIKFLTKNLTKHNFVELNIYLDLGCALRRLCLIEVERWAEEKTMAFLFAVSTHSERIVHCLLLVFGSVIFQLIKNWYNFHESRDIYRSIADSRWDKKNIVWTTKRQHSSSSSACVFMRFSFSQCSRHFHLFMALQKQQKRICLNI